MRTIGIALAFSAALAAPVLASGPVCWAPGAEPVASSTIGLAERTPVCLLVGMTSAKIMLARQMGYPPAEMESDAQVIAYALPGAVARAWDKPRAMFSIELREHFISEFAEREAALCEEAVSGAVDVAGLPD
jgi:hypothetical protein